MAKKKRAKKKTAAKPLKIDPRRFDAGKAKRALEVAEFDHDAVARPIWTAIEVCWAAINPQNPGDKILVGLLSRLLGVRDFAYRSRRSPATTRCSSWSGCATRSAGATASTASGYSSRATSTLY